MDEFIQVEEAYERFWGELIGILENLGKEMTYWKVRSKARIKWN